MQQHTRLGIIGRLSLFAVSALVYATPGLAGMTQDLSDCTAADRKTSVEACTRVMNSGRLPKEQAYIGYFNRASAHFHAGDYDKALADFDKSIERNPGYADTYYKRALVQHERGDRERSLADLDRYLEKKGDVTEARLNRARLFRRRGELSQAFAELQRASAIDPGERKILILRALVLSDLGEQAPAKLEAEKAVAAGSDDPDAYYARATVAVRERAHEAALADIEKALVLRPAFPAALKLRGDVEERNGDAKAAIASFRKALESPLKSLDARMAQEAAKTRLAALEGAAPAQAEPAAKPETSPSPVARVSECRRFIPSAQTTVAVACPK